MVVLKLFIETLVSIEFRFLVYMEHKCYNLRKGQSTLLIFVVGTHLQYILYNQNNISNKYILEREDSYTNI
jgi:hypothetical protein